MDGCGHMHLRLENMASFPRHMHALQLWQAFSTRIAIAVTVQALRINIAKYCYRITSLLCHMANSCSNEVWSPMLQCYIFVFTSESMSLTNVNRPYHCHHWVHGLIHFINILAYTSTSAEGGNSWFCIKMKII